MKKLPGLKAILIVLVFFISICLAKASHVAGGEVTYSHVSGNQYKVQLSLYYDCSAFDPGPSQPMSTSNSCGLTDISFTVNLDTAYEVSQICPSSINLTTCQGGGYPGYRKNVYSAIVTLTGSCNLWTFSHISCCRNTSVNVPSQPSYTFYATLNNQVSPTDNSPYFASRVLPYLCIGQPVQYNPDVVELDGDSLYFSFVSAMDGNSTTPVPYASGYSGTIPLPGITIDPNNGLISFTPSTLGSFVVVVLVKQFDSNGNQKGSVVRDVQFNILNCANTLPSGAQGNIVNFAGSGSQTGPRTVAACSGNALSFDLLFNDTDNTDSLSFVSDINEVFPGSTINSSGYNPLILSVNLTIPNSINSGIIPISIIVKDNQCPIQGVQHFTYNIDVTSRTNAGPDKVICGSQTAILNVTGGSSFSWSVISGPPISVGVNFSCDTCANVIASPASTTTYQVVSNLAGCQDTDTVTVFVFPGYTFNASASLSSLCLSSENQLSITGLSSPSSYSFLWLPSSGLDNNTISSPVATATAAGSFQYYVAVSDSNGCVMNDTVQFSVVASYPPQPVLQASDSSVCAGTTIQLTGTFSNPQVVCGISPLPCISSTVATVGSVSGANTSSTWPTPYGNWYTSQKMQMLFTAAELNAAGINGGKIDQIDFELTAINGIATYHQYTIKMGCTNLTTLSATWSGSLYQVFDPATVNVVVGWNTHVFNNSFVWDGVSNIIVEICSYEGPGVSYTNNSISPYTTTPFTSCIFSYNDAVNMCPDLTTPITTSNNRPVVRFHNCTVVVDSSNYIYSWQPVGSVQSPNSQLTNATVNANTTYTLTVTDTITGCATNVTENVSLQGQGIYIQGNVQYNSSGVNGYAKLYESIPGVPLIDSVAITAGNYIFSNVPAGNFIIQATADTVTVPDAFPTYYDSVVDWSSATVITMATCNDTSTVNIGLLGQPGMIGTNVLAGTIIEGTGYVHSAGMPLANVNVFLMNSSTGIALDHSVSNPGGVYMFNNVPDGCYKIYVDIPGLPVDSMYTVCVSGNDTLTDLHYIADANSVFITNSALSVNESVYTGSTMAVFPNPANESAFIEYRVSDKEKVEIRIIDLLGKNIVFLVNETKAAGSYKLLLQPAQMGLSPGIYMINLKTSSDNISRKLIITK